MGAAARAVGGGWGAGVAWPPRACARIGGWLTAAAAAAANATTAVSLIVSPVLARLLRLAQAAVDRLHEVVRRPETAAGAVTPLVVAKEPRRLDLLQRHPLLDRVEEAVPDDRAHVAVLDHVGFVGQPSVPGNHVGAGLLLLRRHRDVDDAVQGVDHPLKAAALRDLHDRERR